MPPAAPETPASKADAAAAPPKKRFGGKKVKIALIVLGVMALQAVAAILLLPKSHGATQSTSEAAEGAHKPSEAAAPEKVDNLIEVEVGQFSVSLEENDGIVWNISFRLSAGVANESQTHFTECVSESYKARVKQAVVKVVRQSSIKDLRDPSLDLLKRSLKAEMNNVLPGRYVQEIIVSEIRTMQQ